MVVSLVMLGTGKKHRGKKQYLSLATSTAQFLLKMVVSVEDREWKEVTYANIQ